MEHGLRFNWMLLLLLMATSAYSKQATSVGISQFEKRHEGENITGTIVGQVTTRSKIQCSDR